MLAVFANPDRMALIRILQTGEHDVGTLSRMIGRGRSITSQNLKMLRDLGLVETRRENQSVFYSSSSACAKSILSALDESIPKHSQLMRDIY